MNEAPAVTRSEATTRREPRNRTATKAHTHLRARQEERHHGPVVSEGDVLRDEAIVPAVAPAQRLHGAQVVQLVVRLLEVQPQRARVPPPARRLVQVQHAQVREVRHPRDRLQRVEPGVLVIPLLKPRADGVLHEGHERAVGLVDEAGCWRLGGARDRPEAHAGDRAGSMRRPRRVVKGRRGPEDEEDDGGPHASRG